MRFSIYTFSLLLIFMILLTSSCKKDNGIVNDPDTSGFLTAKLNGIQFSGSTKSLLASRTEGPFNIGTGYGFFGLDELNNLGGMSIYVEPVDDIGQYDLNVNSQSFATLKDNFQVTWWNPDNTSFEVHFTEIGSERIKGTFFGFFKNSKNEFIEVKEGEFSIKLK